MFDSLLSLFHFSSNIPHELHSVPGWLPAPGWFAAASAMLMLGVMGAVLLLKSIRLAIELGVAAFVIGFFGYMAYGYVHMGENNLIPELNAKIARIASDDARAESFRQDAKLLQDRLAKEAKAKRAAQAIAAKKTEESINAQSKEVRAIPIPADVGRVLQPAIDATNAPYTGSEAGPGTCGTDQAAASVPNGSGATNVEAWERWSAQVIRCYGELATQAKGLQDYAKGLNAASEKADAEHPPPSP